MKNAGHPAFHMEKLIDHELSLISELNYEGFFLTVENIVSFAKSKEYFARVGDQQLIPPFVIVWGLPK